MSRTTPSMTRLCALMACVAHLKPAKQGYSALPRHVELPRRDMPEQFSPENIATGCETCNTFNALCAEAVVSLCILLALSTVCASSSVYLDGRTDLPPSSIATGVRKDLCTFSYIQEALFPAMSIWVLRPSS